MNNAELIEKFVASFSKLDEMTVRAQESDPVAWELRSGEVTEYGWSRWLPVNAKSSRTLLDPIYAKLPARFPPLYEELVLSYRWAKVDLELFRLLANPLGPDLSGLAASITADRRLQESLVPAGYMQFGQGPDIDYDPVCFDIKSRSKNGDYRIVKIDHEEILCNFRVKVVSELAPSFYELVRRTIQLADSKK
jgi:hypothetical protein